MQLPVKGDIVLYIDQYMGDEYPAIVTAVLRDAAVRLTAFPPDRGPFNVPTVVKYGGALARIEKTKHTWRHKGD